MRYALSALAVACLVTPAAIAQHTQLATAPVTVDLQNTIVLELSSAAGGIAIGDAGIADVSVHDERTLYITGKAYGVTNIHVLDKRGNEVLNSQILVTNRNPARLTVVKGGNNYTYNCAPECFSILNMGDEPGYFQTLDDQKKAIAEGGAGSGAPGG